MLELDESAPVAIGEHRKIFEHPEDRNLCIKVIWDGGAKETQREEKYYRLLEKKNISWELLPRYYGFIETNLGRGAIFDLVRDYDGGLSRSLGYYIASDTLEEAHQLSLSRAFVALKEYLCRYGVITMKLKSQNIVFRKLDDVEGELVLVDSVGNSDLLPICDYSAFFARRKVLRKWRRFETSLMTQPMVNSSLHQMLKNRLRARLI